MRYHTPCVIGLLPLLGNHFSHARSVGKVSQSIPGLLVGSSIVEVQPSFRNVFPASNFNRNVTTSWWETGLMDGNDTTAVRGLTELKDSSFIVLNPEMYKASVGKRFINSSS